MINCKAVHEPRRAFCHHFLLPNRYNMLIGVIGCGKSNALSDMLQSMCPDWVAIYTINPDLEKYQMLTDFLDAIKEE